MSQRNTTVRAMHDVGLAAWFGGSLMGAVGLNGAAEAAGDDTTTAKIASKGWAKWTPVNAAAIGAHLVGAVGIAMANRQRIAGQRGVLASTVVKFVLTVAALAATAYARVLGKKIELASSSERGTAAPADSTEPRVAAQVGAGNPGMAAQAGSINPETAQVGAGNPGMAAQADQHPIPLEKAQQQLRIVQWAIPALTGAVEVMNALHGEQQRPEEQARGFLSKANDYLGIANRVPQLAGARLKSLASARQGSTS
jgi:hypothetical protein